MNTTVDSLTFEIEKTIRNEYRHSICNYKFLPILPIQHLFLEHSIQSISNQYPVHEQEIVICQVKQFYFLSEVKNPRRSHLQKKKTQNDY